MGKKTPHVITDPVQADVILELAGKRPGSEQSKRRARSAYGLSNVLGHETQDILAAFDTSGGLVRPLLRQSRAGRTLYGIEKGLQIVDLRGNGEVNSASVKLILAGLSLAKIDVSKIVIVSDSEIPGLETEEPTSSDEPEACEDEDESDES